MFVYLCPLCYCLLHVFISVAYQWEVMQQEVACVQCALKQPITCCEQDKYSHLKPVFRIIGLSRAHIFFNNNKSFLLALPVCLPLSSQEQQKLQVHLLINLFLYQSATVLPPPPPPPPPRPAPVDPVQPSQSSAYTTAQREPPPAPSSWTSLMSGEWI